MKRTALILAAIMMLAMVLPVAAGAADGTTYGFSGKNADAWYSSGNEMAQDAAWMSVGAWGGDTISRQTGTESPVRIRSKFGMTWVDKFTPKKGSQPAKLVSVYLFADPAMFSANRDLTSAALDFVGMGEVQVWTGQMPWDDPNGYVEPDVVTPITASVKVGWAGTGPLWKESYSSKTRTDGLLSIDRSNSTRRAANATGSIVGSDGTVYFSGTFSDASIYDTRGTGHIKGVWPE